jgi:hypothetical protein
MKIKYVTVIIAIALSAISGTIYMKFFSNEEISIYVCQVGVYSNQDNANTMVQKLQAANLSVYTYQKKDTIVVISDIFLKEKDAEVLGEMISENGMTCAILKYQVASQMQSSIVDKKYETVLKELEKQK